MRRSRSFIAWAGLGLMTLLLGGCAALRHEPPSSEIGVLNLRDAERGSPCQDSLFLALRAQSPDSLNEGQLRYLVQKDRECTAYHEKEARHEGSPFLGGVLAGAVVGVVLAGAAWAASSR